MTVELKNRIDLLRADLNNARDQLCDIVRLVSEAEEPKDAPAPPPPARPTVSDATLREAVEAWKEWDAGEDAGITRRLVEALIELTWEYEKGEAKS